MTDFADLLCLFGDLDMTMWSDIVLTVSLKDTTGSEILISAPPMKSSCKSFRQISRCSSPAPALRNTRARDTGCNYTSVRLFYYKVGTESIIASNRLMTQDPSDVNNLTDTYARQRPSLPFYTTRGISTSNCTMGYSKHTRYLSTTWSHVHRHHASLLYVSGQHQGCTDS